MEPAFRGHRGEMRGKGKDHRDFLGDSGGAGWGGGWGRTVSKTSRFGAPEPIVYQSHSKKQEAGVWCILDSLELRDLCSSSESSRFAFPSETTARSTGTELP